MNTYKGTYKVANLNKYDGDASIVIYRSYWERQCMKYFDYSESVRSWSSEEVVIPYYYEVDKKYHRYFMDFKVVWNDNKTTLIEVKPANQTVIPKGNKRTKKYITEAYTYVKNQNKWSAAQEYCKDRGWSFEIWTENELRSLGILPKSLKSLKPLPPYRKKPKPRHK